MSATTPTGSPDPAASPELDLEFRYDDARRPTELTVFEPESETLTTEWLTVDEETALALDAMR